MAEKTRKLWLDWQRGLAVLYMVEWHTYDSWRADAVATGSAHTFLSIVGGFAAPSFLYMAGMSQLLADGALERKGVAVADRRARAVRRALWLLGVAYVFRAVEFVLGGAWRVPGGWRTILRVDVLNVIAISQGSSERNISLVVQESDAAAAVRALHQAFRLDRTGVPA